MLIDISNLSQEKRAFLKAHPELLKGLEAGIPKQVAEVQTRQKKLSKGKSKLQRDLEEIDRKVAEIKTKADKLRREYIMNPHLREINKKYTDRPEVSRGKGEFVCPVCGRSDEECGHNRMNGKPWCFKCNTTLVPKDKVEKWKKMVNVKSVHDSLKDEFKRRGLDF